MMKKLTIFSLLSLFFFSAFSLAEYEVELDLSEKTVYLVSGDVKLSVENVKDYFSGAVVSSTGTTNTGENLSPTSSGTVQQPDEVKPVFSGKILLELGTGSELEKAIYWMYNNGLTMYDTIPEYRPADFVTREESAKLIGQLFEVLGFEKSDKGFTCNFVDFSKFDPTLSAHIQNVCKRGIFRGNDKTNEYMPHDNLTKGQVLAVLMRILEGKMSDETSSPRWIEYYVKAKTLELTQANNLSTIELPTTREEIALLIYRFKNLIIGKNGESSLQELQDQLSDRESNALYDSVIKELVEQRLDQQSSDAKTGNSSSSGTGNSSSSGTGNNSSNGTGNNSSNGTGETIGTGNGLDLDLIAGNISLADDPEFNEAINWMYDVGITSYNTADAYMPFQTITRGQAAKMFDKFAAATSLTTIRNTNCNFSDIAASEFKDSIVRVCQYGVMNGSNGKFNPNQVVTKAEFVAMLIRLFEGKYLDENVQPRWKNYYTKAIELSLISAQDTVTFNQPIARYEVALFLYRLKVRLTMYNNLNDTKLPDEIVKTIENTTNSGDAKQSGKIYVDILSLNNVAFTDGYIEVFGERYKVKKSTLSSYNVGANSFVWYGDLIDLASDEYVGTITFIMTNGALTEGAIRLSPKKISYYISKDPVTTTYYHLNQI